VNRVVEELVEPDRFSHFSRGSRVVANIRERYREICSFQRFAVGSVDLAEYLYGSFMGLNRRSPISRGVKGVAEISERLRLAILVPSFSVKHRRLTQLLNRGFE
jgi:hypothetical protein